MKGLYFVGGLLIGAAAGVFVGIKVSEKMYADKINDEIDKLKQGHENIKEEPMVVAKREYDRDEMINKPSIMEMAKELNYINETDEEDEDESGKFELISDTDYGEYDDFEMISLYMENGSLTNYDSVNPQEIDSSLEDYINSISGSIDSDSIYIRDGSNMRDYEIIITDSPMEG